MSELTTPNYNQDNNDGFFLPDFCNVRTLFLVIVIAELLAFILAIGPLGYRADRWNNLGLISLFIQWIALTNAALLCILRPHLKKLSTRLAAASSYLLMLLVTVAISEAAILLTRISTIEGLALPASWHIEFLLRNLAISAIVNAVALRYFYIQHELRRNIEAKSQARIQALQARIRPHFLFNSMNTIASLTRSAPSQAEKAIEDLAELFRASLAEAQNLITLEAELNLCRRYLSIEKMRLGERLTIEWDMKDLPCDAMIPPLTIQPLLENAVYHGIEPLVDNSVISITASYKNNSIEIVITNPAPFEKAGSTRNNNHIALENIRERIKAFYGNQGKMETSFDNLLFRARLVIPYSVDRRGRE